MTSTDDAKLINDIVDKLKKQGIFDQFRKECLADVDTKPAYQNLTHRVDGFVNNFLANVRWSPDLNKNQLRDQLRRQLTESQILSSGVERVVDQTVNPKIYKVFKPKVDVIICEYLGIDPKLREDKLKYKAELEQRRLEQEQKQQQQKQQPPAQPPPPGFTSPVHIPMMGQMGTPRTPNFGLPNLMEINFNYPPPPFGSPTFGNPMGMPQLSSPTAIPGFPSMVTSYPSPWNAMGSPFRPASIPSVSMVPNVPGYTIPTTVAAINKSPKVTPTKLDPSIMQAIQGQPAALEEERRRKEREDIEKRKEKEKEREKLEPLTVESLLNVPVPKKESRKERRNEVKSFKERMSEYDDLKEDVDSRDETSQHTESSYPGRRFSDPSLSGHESESKQLDDGKNEDEAKPAKKFHFAWDNLLEEVEDGKSDVTVSSVHTSDLSSFEEEEYSAEEEEAAELTEEGKPVTPVASPEKQPPFSSLPIVSPEKTKPRRLIALQYNYSDSDDEETREERKARIAKEKEERYLRRQQRRAELEAKRKERVIEKATEQQQQQQQQPQLPEQAEVSAPEKQVSGSDAATGASESEMSSPVKRRGRKTKEELKQQLREQKVMEKKMALRRQRRRNPKFVSEEYISIFSERKSLMAEDFMDEEQVVEEQVLTTDMTLSVDYTHGIVLESPPTPTQDERAEYYSSQESKNESETPVTRSRRRYRHSERSHSGSRPSSPLSDVSESSSRQDNYEGKKRSRRQRNEEFDAMETASTRSNDSDRPSQRYSDNDLYKPRTSYGRKRRNSSRTYSPGQGSPHRSRSPDDRSVSPRGGYSPVGRGRSSSPSGHRSYSPDDGHSPMPRRRQQTPGSRSMSPVSHRRAPATPPSTERMDPDIEKATRVSRRKTVQQAHSPPPLDEAKGSAQRYDTSDLYKPHNPSTRASRYLSRAISPENKPAPVPPPPPEEAEGDEGSDDNSNRPRTPVDLVDFGEAAKRNKKPVEKINFGMAARQTKLVAPPMVVRHTSPHTPPKPHALHVQHPALAVKHAVTIPKRTKYVTNELDFGEAARSVRHDSLSPTVQVPGRARPYGSRQPGHGRTGTSPVVGETRMSPHGSPRGVGQVKGAVSPKGKGIMHPLVTPGPGRTPRSYHSDRECSQESDHHSWTRQSSNDEEYEPEYEEIVYEEEYPTKKRRHRSYSREYSYEGKEGSSRDYEEAYEPERRRSSSRRRSMTHSDEGDIEIVPEPSMHEYPPPRKSQGLSPRQRSNSPEEGEIDGGSPEEVTPSPESIRDQPHSPEDEPAPPTTRRYNIKGQREDESYTRRGVTPQQMKGVPSRGRPGRPPQQEPRVGPAPPPAAPMVTRATRRQSEDELMPPSKRLRRFNQN